MQLAGVFAGLNSRLVTQLACDLIADAVQITEGNHDRLVVGNINAQQTRHAYDLLGVNWPETSLLKGLAPSVSRLSAVLSLPLFVPGIGAHDVHPPFAA